MMGLMALLLASATAAEGEVWAAAEVGYEATDAVTVSVTQRIRATATPFGSAEILTDFGASFRAFEHLKLAAAYRVGVVDIGDKPESRHRLAFDVGVPVRVGPVKLSLRERYQVRIGTGHNSERHVFRTRFAAKLKSKGVEPYVSTEPFLRVQEGGLAWTKWRSTVGLGIPVGDHELSVFYRVDASMPADPDPTLHVIGLKLELDIPNGR